MRCLGIDLSTQSCTGVIVDAASGKVLRSESIIYDDDLPQYGTMRGVLPPPAEMPTECHAPPDMWADALALLLARLAVPPAPGCGESAVLQDVSAVAVAAQQHATVYLARRGSLRPEGSGIAAAVRNSLSRPTSPIWMDLSATRERDEIAEAIPGGMCEVARRTGTRVSERFAAAQIRKFAREHPEQYANTSCIHLASSFATALLVGTTDVPIDYADGSGMNLLDLDALAWDFELVRAAGGDELADKLARLAPSHSVVGTLAPHWGGNPGTLVVCGCGDNHASLFANALQSGVISDASSSVAVASLGTSDTLTLLDRDSAKGMEDPRALALIHIAPHGLSDCAALLCFRNGSLAREKVLRSVCGSVDWLEFDRQLASSLDRLVHPATRSPHDDETPSRIHAVLPYVFGEITPPRPEGVKFFVRDGSEWEDHQPETSPETLFAFVVSQIVLMKIHADFVDKKPDILLLSGGGAQSKSILRICSEVFQCRSVSLPLSTDSAAQGAALRAAHAVFVHNRAEYANNPSCLSLSLQEFAAQFSLILSENEECPSQSATLRSYLERAEFILRQELQSDEKTLVYQHTRDKQ